MKISDLVRFNEERFFDGAVQLRWVQERPELAREAATAFVNIANMSKPSAKPLSCVNLRLMPKLHLTHPADGEKLSAGAD